MLQATRNQELWAINIVSIPPIWIADDLQSNLNLTYFPYLRRFPFFAAKQTWQLNAYIFQARGLLAADQSGLSDPYARVCFINQSQKTERLEKTLSPQWDQTLIFENIVIYGNSDVAVDSPPRVTIELFDWDQIGSDSFLGRCSVSSVSYHVILYGNLPDAW